MAQLQIIGGTLQPSSGSITNDSVNASAAIAYTKVAHIHKAGTAFILAIGGTPVTREEIVYTATGPGTVRAFKCLCNDTGTSASVTFDLKKNGTTILSGVVTITNATTDKAVQSGTISSGAYVAGDIFSIALTVSSSAGMVGPYAWGEFDEVGV